MAAETNVEREFKFDVDVDFDPPDLRSLTGRTERLPAQHLTTTYFDTADHRLWARGITLRHRVEDDGGESGKWTLKLPVVEEPPGTGHEDGTARSELTWKGSPAEVPAETAQILAGLVRRSRLESVAVLRTERRRLLLHGPGAGPAWAEIDDDVVSVASGPRDGLRFRQLELELLAEGAPPELQPVLAELRAAGAAPGGAPKFAMAAGLDAVGPPTRPARPGRRSGRQVRSAAPAILATGLDALLDSDFRLRVPDPDGDPAGLDVEAVHRARGAVRRLRADLRALSPVLDPVWVRHTQADLAWLGALLRRLRGEDLLVRRIRDHGDGAAGRPEDAEAVEELVALLRRDRHLGATELCEALASDRYMDLLDRLHAATSTPPLWSPTGEDPSAAPMEETLASGLAARWRVLRAHIEELGPRPDDEALDHVRLAARRLRQSAQAAEPYLGRRAGRTAAAAKRLQSVLGDLHQAAVASRTLRELASHPSVTPAVAFVAGRISGRADAEADRLRRKWRKRARRLDHQKVTGWLS